MKSVSVTAGKIIATGSQDEFGTAPLRANTGSGTATNTASSGITYELTPTVGNGISWAVGGSCQDQKLCD